MEQKAPVAATGKVVPAKPTAKVEPGKAQAGPVSAKTEDREAFSASLPSREEFTKAVLADLERELRDLIATDPDLKGVTKADLAAWVAADLDEAFAAMAKPGWGEA